ncbi:chitinase-like protein PB1E7.04c isoform X5 [Daphnia pulicaria]|uniref:chitinase-like protein PB1E7.04c isoform X5 n=1 Tax=Daphnia pulicaria TaxID=35523 RepID=UPI001EECC4F9|nr:chitinase-like protein PB1E7.04c isoform X5 [Daphnia pulicaria]
MKSDAYVLVTGLMIAALASLPEVQSQDCVFISETQGIIPSGETESVKIDETEQKDKVILSLTTSSGNVSCLDKGTPFSKYIEYLHTENTNLKFSIKKEIGDDLDDGNVNKEGLLVGQCTLFCPQVTVPTSLFIAVTITPVNTQSPKFNASSVELTLDENFPKGLDFSYLIVEALGGPLTVSDKDLPSQNLKFGVSDERFKVLENETKRTEYNDTQGYLRFTYEPRIAVKSQLNSSESPITFNLIATDTGNPSKESLFPITVNIVPQDVRDPEFEKPYYTSAIPDSSFTGILPVKPNVLARDGDTIIDIQLRYEIVDKGGLNVKLKNAQPDKGVPIEIELTTEVEGTPTDKMRYIVIKAIQTDDDSRSETVALAVELPQAVVTTTTITSTLATCPPPTCPTSSTTPSTSSSSNCPACPVTTESVTTCPTECPTCPSECPTTPECLTTQTECPTYPTVPTTCPTIACPTENTPVASSPTTPSPPTSTDSTSCPIVTCPAPNTTTSPLICDCTTTPVAATCPTTTAPPADSTVHFEKQQYASEILENSPVNTFIVELSATTTTSNEKPEYSLEKGYDAKYFQVDPKTGNVTTAQSLPVGDYLVDAIAQIPSGDKDRARIVISVVAGISCNGTQFGSPLYDFPVAERTTGIVGHVDLRSTDTNTDDYTLSISSCSPPSMTDSFDVNQNGDVVVVSPFNWTNDRTRIVLTISAENLVNARMTPISTIVNIDVLDVNEAPQFASYGSSLLIGYPDRTYFDPSVQMPLITVKAYDGDQVENATLTYHVMNEFDVFDMDLLAGSLFVKGVDTLNWETSRTVQIAARDKHGLQGTLNITVKPLSDNFITLMNAKSQSDSLTDETVASDMSRILGCQVVVLRMEKSPALSARVTPSALEGYNYKITLYALNKTTFITRDEFTQKFNQANVAGLNWTVDENLGLSAPQKYQVESKIDTLSQEVQSYTIATAVLGALLGLALVAVVVYLVYVKKFKAERPWSKAVGAASLEVDKKHWDQRSFARSSVQDDETSEGQVDIYNREFYGETFKASSTPVIRFSIEKPVVDKTVQPTQTKTVEEEAYCPPTPLPKKSILKDPNSTTDKSSKQKTNVESKLEDTAGVKFSPTPEVIQVAATASEIQEVDLDKSNKDDDDDDEFLIEEF